MNFVLKFQEKLKNIERDFTGAADSSIKRSHGSQCNANKNVCGTC